MRVVWVTDLHLDHASDHTRRAFLTRLKHARADWILVGGDTGEAPNWFRLVRAIRVASGAEVGFVLGNHDYYRGSVAQVQAEARDEVVQPGIRWLPHEGPVELTPGHWLVGEGGWGDWTHGELGEFAVRDYLAIDELRLDDRPGSLADRRAEVEALSLEASKRLRRHLTAALGRGAGRVLVLTHVPCWVGSAWHQDQLSQPEAQLFFVWGRGGDVILDLASRHPGVQFLVLSGHSHSQGLHAPRPNVTALTAAARYGRPDIAMCMEVV